MPALLPVRTLFSLFPFPSLRSHTHTLVWISPVNQNYEGPTTPYGDAYHGYWMADVSQLNARFGTDADLKALSAALHARGMYAHSLYSFSCSITHSLLHRYLMVDVVVNDVMATSITPDYSKYMFKQQVPPLPFLPFFSLTPPFPGTIPPFLFH